MPSLAAPLSRALVRCYPRRWRQRYADEVLAVLDQHRPRARTVLNLAASAATTHLDPDYRTEGPDMKTLRHAAVIVAAVGLIFGLPFGLFVHEQNWKDSHWHRGMNGSVNTMSFGPGQRILLTGTSGPMDGTDTLWNVADPARPRRLAVFEGGSPAALSPDTRTVATINFSGQPVLWNATSRRQPTRLARLQTRDDGNVWGEAFSPDGRVLATAFTDRIYLWNVTNPAGPRLLRILTAPTSAPGPDSLSSGGEPPNQGDLAFSPDGHLLAAPIGRTGAAVWNVTDPAAATRITTLPGASGFIDVIAFAPGGRLLADVGAFGTVTLYALHGTAAPVRLAAMATLPAAGLMLNFCGNLCQAGKFALGFASDGHALTAIVNYATAGPSGPQAPPQSVRNYVFSWNVTSPQSVTRSIALSRQALPGPGGGDGGQPALAPDGRTVVDGAPFGDFGITLWQLP